MASGKIEFAQWYESDTPRSSTFDPARKAYEDAVDFYSVKLSADQNEQIRAQDKNGMQECYDALFTAKTIYEAKRKSNSRPRKWLAKFSLRVKYYGGVLDMIAQHHPEYTALAWGTIKLLFVGVLNHEETISQLSQTMTRIGDALPQAELRTLLFPTSLMLALVSRIYALMIKFFQRAIEWYTEGRLMHVLHSLTRPSEIRFHDLLDEIRETSQSIDRLAASLAQAEQRDMHRRLIRVEERIISNHTDLQDRFTEVQLSQTLSFLSIGPLPKAEDAFRYNKNLCNRHRTRFGEPQYSNVHLARLTSWASSPSSSVLICQGIQPNRRKVRALAVDVTEFLRGSNIPVIWAFSMDTEADEHGAQRVSSSIDVIKLLILQILALNPPAVKLNAAQFQSMGTESEWLQLLRTILKGLSQLFVVIDLEILGGRSPDRDMYWVLPLVQFFADLDGVAETPVVRVLLVNLKQSPLTQSLSEVKLEQSVIELRHSRRSGGAMRMMRSRGQVQKQGSRGLRSIIRAEQ